MYVNQESFRSSLLGLDRLSILYAESGRSDWGYSFHYPKSLWYAGYWEEIELTETRSLRSHLARVTFRRNDCPFTWIELKYEGHHRFDLFIGVLSNYLFIELWGNRPSYSTTLKEVSDWYDACLKDGQRSHRDRIQAYVREDQRIAVFVTAKKSGHYGVNTYMIELNMRSREGVTDLEDLV